MVTLLRVTELVIEASAPSRLIVQVLEPCAKFRRLPITYSPGEILELPKVRG